MNAVTTAEYVVLEQIDPNTFQQEINAHSKAGYKMVSTHVIFDDSNHTVLYNAVMVREPAPTYLTEWQARMAQWEEAFKKWDGTPAFNPEKHFEQIVMLQAKVQELEKRLLWQRDDVGERLDKIEAQIDWSK